VLREMVDIFRLPWERASEDASSGSETEDEPLPLDFGRGTTELAQPTAFDFESSSGDEGPRSPPRKRPRKSSNPLGAVATLLERNPFPSQSDRTPERAGSGGRSTSKRAPLKSAMRNRKAPVRRVAAARSPATPASKQAIREIFFPGEDWDPRREIERIDEFLESQRGFTSPKSRRPWPAINTVPPAGTTPRIRKIRRVRPMLAVVDEAAAAAAAAAAKRTTSDSLDYSSESTIEM
jgi:hypothetical protein